MEQTTAPGPGGIDHERLDVYRAAVEFQGIASALCSNRRMTANLRDQLERASTSVVLCIAEGAARRTAADKARLFAIARGSAAECVAILDLLDARCLLTAAQQRHGRRLLIRIVQMLTRLMGSGS